MKILGLLIGVVIFVFPFGFDAYIAGSLLRLNETRKNTALLISSCFGIFCVLMSYLAILMEDMFSHGSICLLGVCTPLFMLIPYIALKRHDWSNECSSWRNYFLLILLSIIVNIDIFSETYLAHIAFGTKLNILVPIVLYAIATILMGYRGVVERKQQEKIGKFRFCCFWTFYCLYYLIHFIVVGSMSS